MPGSEAMLVGFRREALAARFAGPSWEYHATIRAGRCVSCSHDVYVNDSGARHLKRLGMCDLVCTECEARYDADIVRSL